MSYSRRSLREQCGRVVKSSGEYAETPITSRGTPGKKRNAFFTHSFPKVSEFTSAYGKKLNLKFTKIVTTKKFNISSFDRIGCPGFTFPSYEPQPLTSHTRSLFWPSEATTGHHRYRNMSKNIRCRRGQKVRNHYC